MKDFDELSLNGEENKRNDGLRPATFEDLAIGLKVYTTGWDGKLTVSILDKGSLAAAILLDDVGCLLIDSIRDTSAYTWFNHDYLKVTNTTYIGMKTSVVIEIEGPRMEIRVISKGASGVGYSIGDIEFGGFIGNFNELDSAIDSISTAVRWDVPPEFLKSLDNVAVMRHSVYTKYMVMDLDLYSRWIAR